MDMYLVADRQKTDRTIDKHRRRRLLAPSIRSCRVLVVFAEKIERPTGRYCVYCTPQKKTSVGLDLDRSAYTHIYVQCMYVCAASDVTDHPSANEPTRVSIAHVDLWRAVSNEKNDADPLVFMSSSVVVVVVSLILYHLPLIIHCTTILKHQTNRRCVL